MTPSSERWAKIKHAFECALELSADERQRYLEEDCDPAIRPEVVSLLESFDDSYLSGSAVEAVAEEFAPASVGLTPGQMIGQFRIISAIGQGGQGAVFKALDTKLDRTVALKLLPYELAHDSTSRKRFYREARLASSLDHPNICAVHDLIEHRGRHFIVMQFVEGKNVRDLVAGRPLEIRAALSIGIQVCEALAAAHDKGIVHRDIKAQNIVVGPTGSVKILDFGLARSFTADNANLTELTEAGSPYGTPTYAAPEQSRGERVDHRADIFSAGVLLYELLTGTWAFHGKTSIDVRHAVLHDEPKPIAERRGEEIPPSLSAIVKKALEKNPKERFASATEMRDALIEVVKETYPGETTPAIPGHNSPTPPARFVSRSVRRRRVTTAIAVLLTCASLAGYFVYRYSSNRTKARADAETVVELAKQRRYFEAYDLAASAGYYLPDNESIARLMPVISDELTVTTNESGARVFLTRYSSDGAGEREFVGVTPIERLRIARGEYLIEIEKDGFAPYERSFSGSPEIYWDLSFNPSPTTIEARLFPAAEVPEGMAFVPGGKYSLASWKRPISRSARVSDFFVGRREVSNKEFKEFVSAGGYQRRQFWTHPFVRDGKRIDWEAAVAELKDKTGLPGPRNWVGQSFPEGRGDHPVTEITWYEAAAYAEFRGGSLPTIFQWEKAARNGARTQSSDKVMPWGYFAANGNLSGRANFAGRDTVPVDANRFGMSPFGSLNMAGNVAEWCLNEIDEGFATAGGSWAEPPYSFGSISEYPGLYSSDRLGFRIVKNLGSPGDDGVRIERSHEVPQYKVLSASEFAALREFYRYDRSALDARSIETVTTPEWVREKIAYKGSNDEQALAYLYLPRNVRPPYQAIQYLPAGDVYGGFSSVPQHVETFAASQIKAGRAVFAVVLEGFIEREFPPGRTPAAISSVRFRDRVVKDVRDLQRGLDYLESRGDIDLSRLAFWGYSAGGEFGLIYCGVESRFRGAVFMSVGISTNNAGRLPEVNAANFASRIAVPKLVISGTYDEEYSWLAETEPMFGLFREPKMLVRYNDGHTPPAEVAVPAITKWLDEVLGPVRRD